MAQAQQQQQQAALARQLAGGPGAQLPMQRLTPQATQQVISTLNSQQRPSNLPQVCPKVHLIPLHLRAHMHFVDRRHSAAQNNRHEQLNSAQRTPSPKDACTHTTCPCLLRGAWLPRALNCWQSTLNVQQCCSPSCRPHFPLPSVLNLIFSGAPSSLVRSRGHARLRRLAAP